VHATYYVHLVTSPLIVLTGLVMMFLREGFTTAWIDIALVTMVCLSASGLWVSRKRLSAIETAARQLPDGPLPAPLARQLGDPVLFTTVHTQFCVGLGILYLMVLRPESWTTSVGAIVVAAVVGMGVAQVTQRTAFRRDVTRVSFDVAR